MPYSRGMTNRTSRKHAADDPAIRPAAERDLPALVELNVGLSLEDAGQRDPFMNPEWPRHAGGGYFENVIADADSLVVVADVQAGIVGYLVGRLGGASSMRPVTTAILESMYVNADHRGRGVGTMLVRSFLHWASERDTGRVAVTAYAANEGALRFYERFGMHPRSVTLDMPLTPTS